MSPDQNTPAGGAQPAAARISAKPTFAELTDLFAEWRETPVHPANLDSFKIAGGDLLEMVPQELRHGLCRCRGAGAIEMVLGLGLRKEEAAERAAELCRPRAASGFHLWS